MKFISTTITPDQAREMLKQNTGNRPIRLNHVRLLARAITNGEWMRTHQCIAIDTTGRILDGQHRLLACIRADVPIKIILVTECDPATFMCLDLGARRSITDVLGGNRRTIECVTRIARIGEVQSSVSPAAVQNYGRIFSEAAELVTEARSGAVALITSAQMRACVAVRLTMHESTYPLELYKSLAESNYEALPALGRALLPRLLRRFYSANSTEFLGLCWYATNPRVSVSKKPYVKNPQQHINEMRVVIRGLMDEMDDLVAA